MSLMRGLVFVVVLGAVACTEVRQEQVPGAYEGTFDGEQNVLTLKPDGVFVWSMKKGDGNAKTRTGTWKFSYGGIVLSELDAGKVVAFEDHSMIAVFGRPQIVVDSERSWCLRRQ
jgi:hypothetical protein